MNENTLHVGLVAGEKSGDLLGAGLIRALKTQYPTARFSGLGGSQMIAEGFSSIADMERLSVMGIIEPLKRLPDLIALRRQLFQHFLTSSVDVLVTIDSPDFNLGLARRLRQQDIPVCHYVCPSVWAWRQSRVNKIRASVDHVLALLPFESEFLNKHDVDSTFVGHPLAEQLTPEPFAENAHTTLCVMPGSRQSEVSQLAPLFIDTIELCRVAIPDLRVVVPAATELIESQLRQLVQSSGQSLNDIHVEPCFNGGESVALMRQADVVLMASGTATLEAGLLGKPMVVSYRISALGYSIARRLVKVEHVSLPNLLLSEPVVPELIQDEATPHNLSASILKLLRDDAHRRTVHEALSGLHGLLARNANERAAEVVLGLAGKAAVSASE